MGCTIRPAAKGDVIIPCLEYCPCGHSISANGLTAVIDVQHQHPVTVDDLNGRADDIINLLCLQQTMVRWDGRDRVLTYKSPDCFFI